MPHVLLEAQIVCAVLTGGLRCLGNNQVRKSVGVFYVDTWMPNTLRCA